MRSHRHPRAARAIGAAALLTALVAGSSCGSSAAQPAASPAPSAPAVRHGAHDGLGIAPATPLRGGERFLTLTVPQPYTPAAPSGGTDEYRCFLLDPRLSDPAFLTGSQFLPQNADIVHHAILFRVDPEQVDAARQVDADTPGQGWTCFGDAGIGGDSAWVGHWAPGADETLLAPAVGYPMLPGSRLVMQVHYNLAGAPGRPGGADRSGIRLRLTDRTDLEPLETQLLMAPVELACAADETGPLCEREAALRDVARRFGARSASTAGALNAYCNTGRAPAAATVQHCDHRAPGKGTVYAVAGHMHLLGRAISVQLNPGTAGAATLLDEPVYDFDEQAVRALPRPVAVRPGDTLRVTCTHDVTLRRQVPQLRQLPPRYVVWGEGTSDEMCLGLVVWSPGR